jgi:CBS domain-containing protein
MITTVAQMTRLGDLPLRSPVVVPPDATIREAAKRLRTANVSSLLVGEPGSLIAILTERDLVDALARGVDPQERVASFSVANPFTISIDASLGEAGELMVESGVRHLVVTAGAQAVAVVSMRDVVAATLSIGSADETIALFCGAVSDCPEVWLG